MPMEKGGGSDAGPGVYGLQILNPSEAAVRSVVRDWNFGELLFGRRVDRKTLKVSCGRDRLQGENAGHRTGVRNAAVFGVSRTFFAWEIVSLNGRG